MAVNNILGESERDILERMKNLIEVRDIFNKHGDGMKYGFCRCQVPKLKVTTKFTCSKCNYYYQHWDVNTLVKYFTNGIVCEWNSDILPLSRSKPISLLICRTEFELNRERKQFVQCIISEHMSSENLTQLNAELKEHCSTVFKDLTYELNGNFTRKEYTPWKCSRSSYEDM